MLAASSARAGFVPLMNEIEHLIQFLARLPGLGPRSARRAALFMLKRRDTILEPLAKAMIAAKERVQTCSVCGNLDPISPCGICANPRRDNSLICVVEDVADLWALERGGTFHGRYHVLGGILSALDGVGPDDLNIASLLRRARAPEVREIILATNATVEGQTTAHYIADRLADCDVTISGLALGVPIGGELDYLDDGTLSTAMRARRRLG
jgi:recombination protein RecR